ncbi:MAG TPA: carbon storage regulator [Pirellulales bacterium]|jgi:carbon storage regulator|nr:carbon storage regulator [Pirellulales bacterium]
MLVLTRKTQQQIQIGENIVITILHVKGQAVRVGIQAPRDIRVIRSEINGKAPEGQPAAEPAAEVACTRRSAAVRAPGNEPTAPKPFSSPDAEPLNRTGESHGLFPHLRRRSRQTDDHDITSERFEPFSGPSSRGLAMRIS